MLAIGVARGREIFSAPDRRLLYRLLLPCLEVTPEPQTTRAGARRAGLRPRMTRAGRVLSAVVVMVCDANRCPALSTIAVIRIAAPSGR
jgi:hypothetical protein